MAWDILRHHKEFAYFDMGRCCIFFSLNFVKFNKILYKFNLYIGMLQCFSFATLLCHDVDPCKLLNLYPLK
jgi:hypothetical protein